MYILYLHKIRKKANPNNKVIKMKISQSLSMKKVEKQLSRHKNRAKSSQHKDKDQQRLKNKHKYSDQSINRIFAETVRQANQNIHNPSGEKTNEGSTFKQIDDGDQILQRKSDNRVEYSWQFMKAEQKRKITGFKAKFKWVNIKQSNWIIVRSVLTDHYIRLNDADYFVQLDSANIDLTIEQQKSIQKRINKNVQKSQMKTQQQKQNIFVWLKNALIFCNNLFLNMDLNERPKSKQVQFKRFTINQNYILYPCPSSITWSPHGLLCLSQNKVGNFSKPIIGSLNSYRKLIQAPYKFERFARKTIQIQDLQLVDQKKQEEQQATEAQFYGWDVKQQINFSVFGKSKDDDPIQEGNRKDSYNQIQSQKLERKLGKDHETFYLGNTNNMPSKLQKIYRRFFQGYENNVEFQFFQKLKIYIVKSQVVEMQDGILYLVDKINNSSRVGVMESLLQNQFSGYSNIFNKSSKDKITFQKLKYQLITEFLQQKIKLTPQSQHFLYMKCIMIQNQFFRLALEEYFEENFKRLKIFDNKYICLGTYDNFDDVNAQKALFDLLSQHLKQESSNRDNAIKIKNKYCRKPQKYDDPFYKQKKYKKIEQHNEEMKLQLKGYVKKKSKHLPQLLQIESQPVLKKISSQNLSYQNQEKDNQQKLNEKKASNRNVNLNLMSFLVVNKIQFIPFQFNLILTPIQRKNLIDTVIPILWIKDRSSQKFQYKLAKRIIIANSKIIKFLEVIGNIGNLWRKRVDVKLGTKIQSRKSPFLKQLLQNYTQFKQKSEAPIGKVYIAYCKSCWGDFTAYSIQQLLRVTLCSRCKYMQQIN